MSIPYGKASREEEEERSNREVVILLYEALGRRDSGLVQQILATDLEWRFHGPRNGQHMKRLLTGEEETFQFFIDSVQAFGPTVIAEGTDLAGSVFWVHAWTVSSGVITQVREYFNTCVTVARVESPAKSVWKSRLARNKSVPGLVLAI